MNIGYKLTQILKLFRLEHGIKNVLIFAPLFFSGDIFNTKRYVPMLLGLLGFSCISSTVYIINDLCDRRRDRQHPVKCNRPLASGAVHMWEAVLYAFLLSGAGFGITWVYFGAGSKGWLIPLLYLVLNLGYSFGLKNILLVDIAILSSGFVLRILYCGAIFNIEISNWLLLSVFALSLVGALGKRRGELLTTGSAESRRVLKYYSTSFLEKSIYVMAAVAITFYSLWSISPVNQHRPGMVWTIPCVIFIFLRYCMVIETPGQDGDPVTVFYRDKALWILCSIYGLICTAMLYSM